MLLLNIHLFRQGKLDVHHDHHLKSQVIKKKLDLAVHVKTKMTSKESDEEKKEESLT